MATNKKGSKKNTAKAVTKNTAKAATNKATANTPEKPVKTSTLGFPTR